MGPIIRLRTPRKNFRGPVDVSSQAQSCLGRPHSVEATSKQESRVLTVF